MVIFLKRFIVLARCASFAAFVTASSAGSDPAGGWDVYQNIETVEVTGRRDNDQPDAVGTSEIATSLPYIARPVRLSDVLRRAPGVNVRTNSRGETLASVRGAGERQLAIFFEGVLLNVPWDNRFDLSQIPLDGQASVAFVRGPASARFGANTAGGALTLNNNLFQNTKISASFGSGRERALLARHGDAEARMNWQFAGSYTERDGLPVPDDRGDFSLDGETIANTDRKQISVQGRIASQLEAGELFVSVLASDTEFGIAPEQGRASDGGVRHWRYPEATHLFAAAGAKNIPSVFGSFAVVAWHQTYDQVIEDYTDRTYTTIQEQQKDDNSTFGASISLEEDWDSHQLSLNVRSLHTRHEQLVSSPTAVTPQFVDAEVFSQTSYTVSSNYTGAVSDKTSLELGVSYDQMSPGQTGGRPATGRFSGVSAYAGLAVRPVRDLRLTFSAARQVRLPTLRELFGEALGRFLINPDLSPETAWQFEFGVALSKPFYIISLTPFATLTENTIDQRRLMVDGQTKRQRINLRGSRTYGAEVLGQVQISQSFSISASAVWSRSRRLREEVDNSARRLYLSNRPNWLANLEATYQVGPRTTFGLEVVHRGKAKSLTSDNQFLDLRSATVKNVSLSHALFPADRGHALRVTLAAENVTNAFVEPQLGLPDPGRRVSLAVQYSF